MLDSNLLELNSLRLAGCLRQLLWNTISISFLVIVSLLQVQIQQQNMQYQVHILCLSFRDKKSTWEGLKLGGVGPVDKRPSTN